MAAIPAAVLSVLVQAEGVAKTTRELQALEGGLQRTGRASDQGSKLVSRFGSALRTTIAYAGTGGLAGALYGAAKAGIDFQKQMSDLKAVTNATGKQMDALRNQAIKAGADTAYSASEAAQAQTELAKGGLKVQKIMGGGLKGALSLAAAGEINLKDAASTTADALNLFGLRGSKATHVADALAQAANATTADVGDFAYALKSGGSAAKAAGVNFNGTIQWLEALAKAGIKGQDAGTSLKSALVKLASPSKKAAEEAKKLGLNFFTAQGKMKPLAAISRMLRDRLGGLTQQQKLAVFSTQAGTDGMRALLALYDAGPKKLDAYKQGLEKQGTAAKVAAQKQNNLAGDMEQLGGSLETLAIKITSGLLPAARSLVGGLTRVVNAVGKAIDWFKALPGPIKTFIYVFGGAVTAIKGVQAAFAALKAASLALSFNPIVIAIGAVIAAGVLLITHWDEVKKVAVQVFGKVRDFIVGAWDKAKDVTRTVWAWIKDHLKTLLPIIATLITGPIGGAVVYIVTHWDTVKDVTQRVWGAIKGFLGTVWAAIEKAAGTAWDAVKTAVLTPMRAAGDLLSGLWEREKNGLAAIWDQIKGAAGKAWDTVKRFIVDPVRDAVGLVKDALGIGKASGLIDALAGAWDTIKGGVESAFRGVANTVIGFVNAIIDAINIIPGVDIGKVATLKAPKAKASAAAAAGAVPGFFRGGVVNRPMAIVGEEAPRHPEFVIPTNPAYRSRAVGLLGQAAGALGLQGFAKGGVTGQAAANRPNPHRYWNFDQLAALWVAAGGPASASAIMAHVALAESGGPGATVADAQARNSIGATGLWQIYNGPGTSLSLLDPMANARAAVAKYLAGGLGPWVASRDVWGKYLDNPGGGFLGGVADALKTVAGLGARLGGAVAGQVFGFNPADLLSKVKDAMPAVGSLPGWLAGMGKSLIGSALDFAENEIGKLNPFGGGGGSAAGLAPRVLKALAFARANGWTGSVSSGLRSLAEQQVLFKKYGPGRAAVPGTSNHERGLAVDVTDPEGFARAMAMMPAAERLYRKTWENWHFSTTGYARGGVIGRGIPPFVGSYAHGGVVPQDGLAYVHQGERITPQGGGGPLIGTVVVNQADGFDEERLARKLDWLIDTAGV